MPNFYLEQDSLNDVSLSTLTDIYAAIGVTDAIQLLNCLSSERKLELMAHVINSSISADIYHVASCFTPAEIITLLGKISRPQTLSITVYHLSESNLAKVYTLMTSAEKETFRNTLLPVAFQYLQRVVSIL